MMNGEIVIRAEGLGKRYRIGTMRRAYGTLRDALTERFRRSGDRAGGQNPGEDEYIWALKDVSLKVRQGEVLGIVGRNGAGKSTLLKILSRITSPTEGRVEFVGRVGSLLEVGTGFHPELTGRENIFLNGAILGMSRSEIRAKFDEIVAFAEIEKFLDTPVKRYSSGMYVRLAFAVAAHLEPDILLVDEVLAVGDYAFQKKCLGKMGDVTREGRTVLFVSHNMASIRSLCQRGILLNEGRVEFEGDTETCINQYLDSFHTEQIQEIDTLEMRRPEMPEGLGDQLRFARVILDSPNRDGIIPSGEPVHVKMEIDSRAELKDVIFGVGIYTPDGSMLFNVLSNIVDRLSPGRHQIECTLTQNPLAPGSYILGVGARCGDKSLDWLPRLMSFEIRSAEQYKSVWLEEPSGLFRVPSKWSDIAKID